MFNVVVYIAGGIFFIVYAAATFGVGSGCGLVVPVRVLLPPACAWTAYAVLYAVRRRWDTIRIRSA